MSMLYLEKVVLIGRNSSVSFTVFAESLSTDSKSVGSSRCMIQKLSFQGLTASS